MDRQRWKEIEAIYQAAVDRTEDQRRAYLDQVCADDAELRSEVEALLAVHESQGARLEVPALEQVAQAYRKGASGRLVGKRLGPCEVLSLLGKGGMGEVYLARDTRLDRQVALKVLPLEVTEDPERLKRFVREAKAASALEHPNIATIHELGEAEGVHYIVMEYVKGETLGERIAVGADPRLRPRVGVHGGAPLQIETILGIGIQVADALEEAHRQGITHRDIKPANLMLTPRGQVKVLDFGLAKRTHQPTPSTGTAASTESQTTPGLIMGTVDYMSPEQVLGKEVDQRTDLFSLGVVLYDMVTGRLPFSGASSTETMGRILHAQPEAMALSNHDTPLELERIVSKCLEKDRDLRYQTASDLRADLKRLKRDTDAGKSAAYPAPAGHILPRWNVMRWIAVTALLAVLIIPLYWYLSRQKSEMIREPMRIVPFTTLPGMELNPKFSPDGKFVSFAWNGPARDNSDIYVKQVGGEGQLRLTSDPADDCCPVWSPDGGEIAFVRVSGEVASIYTIPSLGGAERKLYELNSGMSYLSWSPDGGWLAFSEKSAVESPARIYLLSLDTRQKIPLTSPPPGSFGDLHPEYSPDGKRVAFARRKTTAVYDLWVQPVSSTEATRLTYGNYSVVSRPAWTADGHEVVFAAGGAGVTNVFFLRIPVTGGAPQAVAGIGENASQPTIWGNHMVFMQYSGGSARIWRMRGPNYQGEEHSAAPILASTRSEWGPDYSPDGKKLAFTSERSGFSEIWTCDSDGANPVQLTFLRKLSADPRWSPDGKRIAFGGTPQEDTEIYVIDADRGIPHRLTNEKSHDEIPSWSRDGWWIYFSSNRSGSFQVWKMPSKGGEAVQVTKGGGYYAIESFDGKILYYTKPGRQDHATGSIWKVPCEGGQETLVLDRVVDYGNWALRPEGIYFSTYNWKKYTIEFLNFQTRKVTLIYQEETPKVRFFLAISPDGQWVLYNDYESSRESDLMLVENFH